MSPRTIRLSRFAFCRAMVLLAAGFTGPQALADPIYTITDLGTLNGQTSSVATGINNQGQVVGISYNSSDGNFIDTLSGSAQPPVFQQTGNGAQSFLYSGGQTTQISPTGGLATSINDEGQVVGGAYNSINDAGQYVGGPALRILMPYNSGENQLVSSGSTTNLGLFAPYAINNAGQIAGFLVVDAHGGTDFHPAIYQGGQVTDLFSKVASGEYYDSRAIAINQHGDMLFTVHPDTGTVQSYLYQANTGKITDLTSLPGGSGLVAAALNDNDQAVGNGFLYSNGSIQTLSSLITPTGGWSSLNATGINDLGQIVGQGLINGQEHAFLMTPDAVQAPEPGTLAIWGLISAWLSVQGLRTSFPRVSSGFRVNCQNII